MKLKNFIYIFLLVSFIKINYSKSSEIDLDKNFIPLKDFIVLKYELFLKDNVSDIFKGGGLTQVAYQEIKYNVKVDKENKIIIVIQGIMNKERYKSKKYYPKISDCNQIRNKIFVKKYGYSFFNQNLNYSVNEENLSSVINDKILNISSLNKELKDTILNNTIIKIKVVHPKSEKNISCSGKLISLELK